MFRPVLLAAVLAAGYPGVAGSQAVSDPPSAAPTEGSFPFTAEEALPRPADAPASLGGLGGLGGLMGGLGGGGNPGNSYSSTWLPSQPTRGQAAHLGMFRQDLSAMCPLYADGGDMVAARANLRWESFDTNAVLPDSHRPFPSDLYNVNLGLIGVHRFDNGWSAGGMVNFGSASDHPFASVNTLNVSVMGFLRVPTGERDSWMFSLMYSPLGQLAFPLPGIAYSWNPSDEFSMNVGLPLSVRYRPTQDWTFEASYMLLTTVHTQATYRLAPSLNLYGGFDWINEGYYLRDSLQPTDSTSYQRFRYYEKHVKAGVQYTFGPARSFDLSGGYAFDRNYNQGSGIGLSGSDRVTVGSGPFVSGQVRLKW